MASVNKVILLGNLGADPDVRYTAEGNRAIAQLSIATTRRYRNQQTQELVSETEWHRVVMFGRTAEVAKEYLHKGNPVYIEGRLRTRKWQDQNGQDRYTTEIKAQRVQFLDRRSDGPRADMGGYEDDYGAPAPAPRAPRGGNMGGGQRQAPRRPAPQQRDDDLGPAFPSEASNMDEVPF